MTALYCYKVDLQQLSQYSKELGRNDLEITPIHQMTELTPQDLLLVHLSAIDPAIKLPNTTVVLYSQATISELEKKQLTMLCEREMIFGHINTDLDPLLFRPFFNRLGEVSRQRQNLIRLAALGSELDQLTEQTRHEMAQVKKLHEKIIPVRNEVHKGLTIHSKYAAGASGGGEFFDFHHQQGEFLFILSSSTSYLMTSSIINRLEFVRSGLLNTLAIRQMIEGILEDAKTIEVKNRGKRNGLDLTVIHVNLKKMTLSGYQFGNGRIISANNLQHAVPRDLPRDSQFIDQANFTFPLKRGERLLFLSAGVVYNTNELMEGEDMESFLRKKLDLTSKDLLNELFFQLKKDLQSEFLDFDASAISIEVDQNAIFQI